MAGFREKRWKKLVLGFRHAEQFRLLVGQPLTPLLLSFDTSGYQSLISKSWEGIHLSQYEPPGLEAWSKVCVLKHWRVRARSPQRGPLVELIPWHHPPRPPYISSTPIDNIASSIRCDALALIYEPSIPLENLVLALDVLEAQLSLLKFPYSSEFLGATRIATSKTMVSRKSHPKSRNGCANCKKRRIKVRLFGLRQLQPSP